MAMSAFRRKRLLRRCGWGRSKSSLSLLGEGDRPKDGGGVSHEDTKPLRMRGAVRTPAQYGNVSIPQEAFIAALRMGEEWGRSFATLALRGAVKNFNCKDKNSL